MTRKVYVGLSGGVDSSLTAALLKEQGYDVTAVYMKNWTRDLPGFICPWQEDFKDAKRVAVDLGIPIKVYDFESQYRKYVVDYLISGYQKGITPNPDIICNQEIKFKLFLNAAFEDGAELIATGHYSIVKDGRLYRAKDKNKDQSYFLYRISPLALKRTIMPVGEMTKPAVRAEARKRGLITADKKDSQGICFIGSVGIKDFLIAELGPQKPGDIIGDGGQVIGRHDGAIFYTIGQRHGLNVGGGLPYYVTHKDMVANKVYVTTKLDNPDLWSRDIKLVNFHWTGEAADISGVSLSAITRYRAKDAACRLSVKGDKAVLSLDEAARAVTPGQSAVIYGGDLVIGGGIISS